MSQTFKRTIEDFFCLNCGREVSGNGYTNHCPYCLWSKHVDIYPGDRANICQGAMKPLNIELEQGKYVIVHQCQKCGFAAKNKAVPGDQIGDYLNSVLQ